MEHVNVRVPVKIVPYYFPSWEMPIYGIVAVPLDIIEHLIRRRLDNVAKILLKFNKRYDLTQTTIS